jgi:hypothetical protein
LAVAIFGVSKPNTIRYYLAQVFAQLEGHLCPAFYADSLENLKLLSQGVNSSV